MCTDPAAAVIAATSAGGAVADANRMGFTRPRDLLVVAVVAAVLAYWSSG